MHACRGTAVSDLDKHGEDVVHCHLGPEDNFTLILDEAGDLSEMAGESVSGGGGSGYSNGLINGLYPSDGLGLGLGLGLGMLGPRVAELSGRRAAGRRSTDFRLVTGRLPLSRSNGGAGLSEVVMSGTRPGSAGHMPLVTNLDRETTPQQRVTITCQDAAGNSASRVVLVHLIDVNDHSPEFLSTRFIFRIAENRPPRDGHEIWLGRAAARDLDEAETRTVSESRLVYRMAEDRLYGAGGDTSGLAHLFRVDEATGDVYARAMLDREEAPPDGIYQLTVLAMDAGHPVALTGSATVEVHVLDVNDWEPVFTEEVYMFSVSEDAPLREVVGQVEAVDRDATSLANRGGNITYRLVRPSAQAVAGLTGLLLADHSAPGLESRLGQRRTVSAPTHLRTRRRRGADQQFSAHPTPRMTTTNTTRQPRLPALVEAGGTTASGMIPVAGRSGLSMAPAHFAVDSQSGHIRVIRPLDRETKAHYTLLVIAVDSMPPPPPLPSGAVQASAGEFESVAESGGAGVWQS
ncbi:unnamed protein product, partial [Protopolystoma xenopodis]